MNESRYICRALIRSGARYSIKKLRIHIRGQAITEISPTSECHDDYPGFVLAPSFCNMHAHLGESIYRGISGDQWTLKSYLDYTSKQNKAIPKENQQKIWEQSADITIEEMNRHGITLFCAGRSAMPAKRHHELTMAGYPIMNNDKIIEFKERGVQGFEQYVSEHQCDRVSIGVFLHSLYANDRASLNLAQECMRNGSEFLTIHVSEDKESRHRELQMYGESPICILKYYGLLTEKTLLIHCGHVDDVDLEMIADSGATIVICPISNCFLNTTMPDLNKLDDMRIPWCIATDGWATGRTLSLIEQAMLVRQLYPSISLQKLYESITSIPGALFHRKLYTGQIEQGSENRFLQIKYDGNSAEELIHTIMMSHQEMSLISMLGGEI